MKAVSGIVAYDDNRCMGHSQNGLPWHIPEDLEIFKAKTIDQVVIMGRKTWDSLPRAPLPHRLNLIVSASVLSSLNSVSWNNRTLATTPHPKHDSVRVCANLRVAIAYAERFAKNYQNNFQKIFVIGGAQLFKSAFDDDLIDKLYVTRVKGVHQGDIFFPALPTTVRWSVKRQLDTELFETLLFERL